MDDDAASDETAQLGSVIYTEPNSMGGSSASSSPFTWPAIQRSTRKSTAERDEIESEAGSADLGACGHLCLAERLAVPIAK